MRVKIESNEFEVEVRQRNLSASTLHVSLETNDGDVELYMNAEKIQELIDKMQESLNEYKSHFR